MKRVAVIDIGSNSVRIMLKADRTVKRVAITQLGKGLAESGMLQRESMDDSLTAIGEFLRIAEGYTVYAFATEAVRSAKNGRDFVREIKDKLNIEVDVLTGEEEARAGYLGATEGKICASVLDVGGASTEIVREHNGDIIGVSVPIGAVKARDLFGEDGERIKCRVNELTESDIYVQGELIAIGGTATAIGACLAGLNEYSRDTVHGMRLTQEDIMGFVESVKGLSAEERVKRYPVLHPKRASVIVSGAYVILGMMKRLGAKAITLSDSDNTEGYLLLRNYEN